MDPGTLLKAAVRVIIFIGSALLSVLLIKFLGWAVLSVFGVDTSDWRDVFVTGFITMVVVGGGWFIGFLMLEEPKRFNKEL